MVVVKKTSHLHNVFLQFLNKTASLLTQSCLECKGMFYNLLLSLLQKFISKCHIHWSCEK